MNLNVYQNAETFQCEMILTWAWGELDLPYSIVFATSFSTSWKMIDHNLMMYVNIYQSIIFLVELHLFEVQDGTYQNPTCDGGGGQ